MMLEMKLKKAALTAALDISLKRMHNSPERCARNLTELGFNAFPGKYSAKEQSELLKEFLTVCKDGDTLKTRDLFFVSFLQ
jgi:hypothetical protein